MPEPFAGLIRSGRENLPLLRDIAGTSAARIYSTVILLVSLMLTARWLGPHGRGVVVVVTTWVTLFASLANLSIGQVLVHRAANEPDDSWVGPALSAISLFALVVTLGGWTAIGLLYAASPRLFEEIPALALAIGFAGLPFLLWEQIGSALLSIVGRLKAYNLAQIAGRTLGVVLMIVLIRLLGLGIYGFLIAFVAAQLVVATGGAAVLVQHVSGRITGGMTAIGSLMKDGLKIHLNTIGMMLVSGVDILMLQYFRGPAEVAIFQLPMQLLTALLLVPQAAQLTLPGRLMIRSRAEFWSEHKAVMAFVIGGLLLAGAVVWLFAPWIVIVIGSSRFEASIPVLRILLLALPGAALSALMTIQWITRGYFFQAAALTLAMGLASVGLNLLLIPMLGATGAAWSIVISWNLFSLAGNLGLAALIEKQARSTG